MQFQIQFKKKSQSFCGNLVICVFTILKVMYMYVYLHASVADQGAWTLSTGRWG